MPSVAPRSLVVYPIVLGGGTALFKDVRERHALRFSGPSRYSRAWSAWPRGQEGIDEIDQLPAARGRGRGGRV
jgi:hypothetical protein